MGDILVWIIIAIAVAYTVKNIIGSLKKKDSGGCGGCAGCGGGTSKAKDRCTLEHPDSTDFKK